jgi:galactonate dehydratase
MKITTLDAYSLRESSSNRAYTLLKVSTAEGVSGWGESVSISAAGLARARSLIVGQEESRYDYLTRQFAGDPISAALNMALLDLAGKRSNVPVFQLLGGPTRNKVRAITYLESDAELESLLAQGHRAFLTPVEVPRVITSRPRAIAAAADRFAALRRKAGDNVDFAADGQNRLPSAEASDLAVALEPFHPLWFDQPCSEANTAILQRISSESVTPLGFGRDMNEIGEVQSLLRDGLIDIVRLPLSKMGLTPIRRAAAIAETYYVAVAPFHASGGPVATAAALHLAACLPNFFIQQIPAVTNVEIRKLRDDLAGAAIENVKDGYLGLSMRPGLGLNINESVLRRLSV